MKVRSVIQARAQVAHRQRKREASRLACRKARSRRNRPPWDVEE